MIEKKMERGIKKLRTENGLKFVEKNSLKFCTEEGVTRHHTCIGTTVKEANKANKNIR